MRYALNVTAINGWQTLRGDGVPSALALSAAADGYKRTYGAGQADTILATDGSAYALKPGNAQGDLAMTTTGRGISSPANKSAINFALTTAGIGYKQAKGIGSTGMAVTTSGAAYAFKPGKSDIQLVLTGNVNGVAAPRLPGVADLILTVRYGIPANPPHQGFLTNKRDRSMLVESDNRRMSVQSDTGVRLRPERPLRVARENRRA